MNDHNPGNDLRGSAAQSVAAAEAKGPIYPPLADSIQELVGRMGMLTGIAVAYGTRTNWRGIRAGGVQEVTMRSGLLVPHVRPVREGTLYDLASLTKLFTLVSVMQLISCGQISLKDRVGRIEPRFGNLAEASVEAVLRYEATLETPERIDEQADRGAALEQVFSMRARRAEASRPYSDMNALVLKYVVERAGGMPFFEYVRQNILAPAGMGETFAQVPPERVQDCACYNYEHRIIGETYRMREDVPLGVPHDAKARVLSDGGRELCGHAGLFSTLGDMVRFCQALLAGKLLPPEATRALSVRRANPDGRFRQYLGVLCFVKGPVQRFSEVPAWMSDGAVAQSGFTGNHVAVDPEKGVFDLFLGNRCHNRVSVIQPPEGVVVGRYGLDERGVGDVPWPDGRRVRSSYLYVHQKDEKLHGPVWAHMKELGWM